VHDPQPPSGGPPESTQQLGCGFPQLSVQFPLQVPFGMQPASTQHADE
jgi:hypothetical protein